MGSLLEGGLGEEGLGSTGVGRTDPQRDWTFPAQPLASSSCGVSGISKSLYLSLIGQGRMALN